MCTTRSSSTRAAAVRGLATVPSSGTRAPAWRGSSWLRPSISSTEDAMRFTRRQFVKGGISAFTVGFAAPQFLTDLAFAQAAPARNLVVLYLSGGNDALSTLVPYRDAAYYSRRPTLAVPAGNVLQIGSDSSGVEL